MRIISFEFLSPRRPVSLQTKKKENLQAWKNFVGVEAQKVWKDNSPIKDGDLQLTLVYLCDEFAPVVEPTSESPDFDLINDSFIGMWSDRQDLADSTAWVRGLRETEWSLLPYP